MEIVIVEDYQQISKQAAAIVATEIRHNSKLVLGLATGSTPEGMYARLVEMYLKRQVDFSGVISFNLDEYAGISPDHPQSYHFYMHRHLFDHINIKTENIHIPKSEDLNSDRSVSTYDRAINDAGGIDLQILGIGCNGHIGFNEPGCSLSVYTHLADLAEKTIKDNSRFFASEQEVPRQAITMGIGSIMHAAKIILLASGHSKAAAVQQMTGGMITTEVPASLLQLHRNVIVIIDQEAAALIK